MDGKSGPGRESRAEFEAAIAARLLEVGKKEAGKHGGPQPTQPVERPADGPATSRAGAGRVKRATKSRPPHTHSSGGRGGVPKPPSKKFELYDRAEIYNERQLNIRETFCQVYALTDDKAESYLAAVPSVKEQTAVNNANKFLREPWVLNRLKELRAGQLEAVRANRGDVIAETARLAFFDPGDMVDENGNFKPLSAMPKSVRVAVSAYEIRNNPDGSQSIRVKMTDKLAALQKLAKWMEMFEADKGMTADDFADALAAGIKRAGLTQAATDRVLADMAQVVDVGADGVYRPRPAAPGPARKLEPEVIENGN